MKRNEDFRNALGQPDEYFRQSVMDTLQQLNAQARQEDRPQKRTLTRAVCVFAAAAVVCAGFILVRHRLGGLSDDQTDNVVQTTAVLSMPSGRNTVETELATLTFDKAVKDGPRVLISVEARPKHEDCFALTTDFTLGNPDTDATAWEYYGIQPGEKDQTLYHWVKDHGCREALAIDINSSRAGSTESPFYGDYYVDDVRLMEDGSIRLTVAGEYIPDRDTYELEWMAIPLNMEDTAGFSVATGTEHGSIQIGLDETQVSLTADVPPEGLPAVDTELATLTFMKAEKDETGVILTVKVQPGQEECIVCADKNRLFTALEVTRSFFGVQPAEPYQSMNRWIASHGYRKMLSVEVCPSGDGQASASVSSCRIQKSPVYEDGSAVMTVSIDPMPGAVEMEMAFSVSLWDVNDDGGQIGSDVTIKRSFRIDVSEEPEQEEEGTLHIRLTE